MTEALFAGRYRLERRLGVGGMSTVQLAFDTRLERYVAVKLLAEHLAAVTARLERAEADRVRTRAAEVLIAALAAEADTNDRGILVEALAALTPQLGPAGAKLYSRAAGVLRGLHFQSPPFAQDKLVRVSCGAVFDVAVDIRRSSPTCGQWVGARLSAAEWNQVLIPKGFAHGFLALEPNTEVQYKVTAPYNREHDLAIRFDDPAIGIEWPMDARALILSDRDRQAPLLADINTGF